MAMTNVAFNNVASLACENDGSYKCPEVGPVAVRLRPQKGTNGDHSAQNPTTHTMPMALLAFSSIN